MKIVVIGTGYVGLVTGACLAEVGINVVCVDIDQQKIEALKRGDMPIYEPGLKEMIARIKPTGRLTFSTSLEEAIKGVELIFNAVGTPQTEQGAADLTAVWRVAEQVGQSMESYKLFVTKSTVPVGTSAKIREIIEAQLQKRGVDIEFDVASNPEFMKEGDAINDFMRPDRVVVGVESERARQLLTNLYRPLQLSSFRVIFMDILSAEMTKYAANAMLATRISFMNDIANLSELVGADVNMVRKGVGSDTRIGNKFLYPGAGYGGSCFPKDIKALMHTAEQNGYRMRVLEAVDGVNERQKRVLFDKLLNHYGGSVEGRKIAMWGLSFKPETDDVREATSLILARLMVEAGATLTLYDPVAMERFMEAIKEMEQRDKMQHGEISRGISYVSDKYEALVDADALLIITEWKEFRIPSWEMIKRLMKRPLLLDGRNIYDRREMEQEGITYINIGGRNPVP